MTDTRKLAAILAADVAGYSRLASADEDRTLARLRALRSDLIDPTIAVHNGRVVKRTGDGMLIEFRSVVDAVRCAIEVQNGMVERNAGLAPERRIEFRVGIHLGDVVEESDGDLMGDGVNIAARLEGIARPGTICLSEDAYRQVKARLDLAVSDLGEQSLKNIAEPVRAYALEVGKPAKPTKRSMLAPLIAGAVVALLIVAGAAWYFLGASRTTPVASNTPGSKTAAHLSIAVLPFTNLSNDPGQDYFADGVTENLITDLSRIRNSFVIARNTSFTYKGKSIDARQVGKELGVRYVLEGSVQRQQNRVRVNAQLIDADSGAHVWADRLEDDVADLFKLQDQVVARLANTLGNELVKAEAGKSSRSQNPDAIDLVMRGRALLQRNPDTKDNVYAARDFFQQALRIDPNDADALAGEANTYCLDFVYNWADPGIDYEAKILPQVDRAITLAPDNVWAYYTKSIYLNIGRPNEALGAANAGLAVNPNSATLYGPRSDAEINLGRYEQAESDVRLAMRLSPRDPDIPWWYSILGRAALGQTHYKAAIDEFHRAIDAGQRNHWVYRFLAVALVLEGKMDEAKAAVAEARRLNPTLSVGIWNHLLAQAEFNQGNYAAAIDEFHKAIDAGYRFFFVYANLAAALALEGRMEEAKAAVAEARRLNPNLTLQMPTAPRLPRLTEGLRKAGLPEE
jgi:adenylate cyclase